MKIKYTYIADDGTEFASERDCISHELRLKVQKADEIYREIQDLDEKIWHKYYPNQSSEKLRELCSAPLWLEADIKTILSDKDINLEKEAEYIFDTIRKNRLGDIILSEYINQSSIITSVNIKRDFYTTLREENDMTNIASKLKYSFSDSDIKELAKLHKNNKFREKIEKLLTCCNFHHECGMFACGKYDEFL